MFEKILFYLQSDMETPTVYGLFHICWLIIGFISIYILFKKKVSINKVLIVYSSIALLLEILKQFIWSFNYDPITNITSWDYQWYAFPFQLCTTPIYVCILSLFINNERMKTSLYSYMSFITILGSITTMIYPISCFVDDILVNVHTMWLHVGSFVVSVYLLLSQEVKTTKTNYKNAYFVFLGFVCIASVLNAIVYYSGCLNGETFNMFYISPYFDCSLPVFNEIYQIVPYSIFIVCYCLAIFLGENIIYFASKKLLKGN